MVYPGINVYSFSLSTFFLEFFSINMYHKSVTFSVPGSVLFFLVPEYTWTR